MPAAEERLLSTPTRLPAIQTVPSEVGQCCRPRFVQMRRRLRLRHSPGRADMHRRGRCARLWRSLTWATINCSELFPGSPDGTDWTEERGFLVYNVYPQSVAHLINKPLKCAEQLTPVGTSFISSADSLSQGW